MSPWGAPESPDNGHMQEEGGQAGLGGAGLGLEWVWMCEWSVPPLPLSGPVSQSCSPSSSVSVSHLSICPSLFVLMSPSLCLSLLISVSPLLFLFFISILHLFLSLLTSLIPMSLCPLFVPASAAAAGFLGPSSPRSRPHDPEPSHHHLLN